MAHQAGAGGFALIEAMLRRHSGLKRAGSPLVNAFVEVARQVWEESSGAIASRSAGDRENFIPFSPVGTKRNLADTTFRQNRIRIDFKIPEEVLPTIDPNGLVRPLADQQGRRRPFNRTYALTDAQNAPFVADLILACVLDRQEKPDPPAGPVLKEGSGPRLPVQGGLRAWWDESERAFRAEFWRLCVILCTGILEGKLREVLEPAVSPSRQGPPMDLVDLLRHAKEKGVLGPDTVGECHAVRQLRNRAVHPPRSGELSAVFTREVASIARQVVERCYQELSRGHLPCS
jgi:hypothetical protein